MTCSDDPGAEFEFIPRPVVYPRKPFQLTSGELVTFESRFFSLPAHSLLAAKRLFTQQASHPVASGDVKLYINRDAGVTPNIEPTLSGVEYLAGTPHYVDYITDMRSLLSDVFALHAADSDWPASQFLEAHLSNARTTYTTDVGDGQFVHPEPANTVPSGATPPGSSGSIPPPGDGFELGAQQMMDIDMDEIMYQPTIRPKNQSSTLIDTLSIPTEPIFPAVITTAGVTPTLNSLDGNNYNKLALGVHASGGGLLVTGDVLIDGAQAPNLTSPSIKFLTGSGQTGVAEGAFREEIPWALYPAQKELCSYYTPEVAINTINASGRQALFTIPAESLTNNTVLLLNVSEAGTSGQAVANYPANYHATSGIDSNGHAHNGMHICNKLIYDVSSNPAVGFSPVNGQKVFAHYLDSSSTSSKGLTWSSAATKYQNGDNLFGKGQIVSPSIDSNSASIINWASTNNLFSPASWAELRTSALQPLLFFGNASVNFQTADIQAGSDRGVMSLKQYAQWGFIDTIVFPDLDRAQGGQRQTNTITTTISSYKEGTGGGGEFAWIELDDSPVTSTSDVAFYENTFGVNNIFSFFFNQRPGNGFVHVNGDIYVQWTLTSFFQGEAALRNNQFAPIGDRTFILTPPTTRSDVIITIGFFPSWARRRYVTVNNQVSVPSNIALTPAGSAVITFDPDIGFDDTFVTEYGVPVWDPDEGVNYIYFRWNAGGATRIFFAHMDTNFVIFRINQVPEGVLFGRTVLLSV